MSVTYGNSIVTNGLIMYYDAVNVRSYPDTGTNWYDLSGNNNNATLINGPTYSNDSFTLNGINQYAYLPGTTGGFFDISTNSFYADTGYAWTVNAWFNFPVTPVGTRTGNAAFVIAGKSGGIGGAETMTIYVGSGTDGTYILGYIPYYLAVGIRGAKTIISPAPVNTGIWNNVSVTWDGSAGRVYLNGADKGAANIGGQVIQTGYYFSVGVTGNAGAPADSLMQFEGKIGIVQVYNRALSATEVLQNFNFHRSRYGI